MVSADTTKPGKGIATCKQLPAIPNILKLKRETSAPRRLQDTLLIALFLLPALILFLLFVIYPIFRSIYFSLFDWNGLGPAVDFVGLENFKNILTDQVFLKALRNVLLDRSVLTGIAIAPGAGIGGHGRTRPARARHFPHHFFSALCPFRGQCSDHVDAAV